MEPIPETLVALDELDIDVDDTALPGSLVATAERAREVASGLVGVSLALRQLDVTFTVVATDDEIATLDAVQYVSSGPCVDAIDLGHGIATSPGGLLDESRWRDFARASAAAGVHSTLTLPVVGPDDVVVATVNLYGSSTDTFEGRHQQLADVFGAWAPGAVTNADLSFSTRRAAEQAPDQLEQLALVDTATGIIAAAREIPVTEARWQLEDAADRAGVPVVRLARVIVGLHDE
ncbi:ANTAR domain-containing protein [Nocardioides cavernae]|uniref:ANTAR domain-containing protein n=1 Tax=Nocardioides cavernae TaxID=1921566 RepID=A0ABR8NDN9_9ACTN|nr:ANTAR domain-containing protein [Nocardioides cavernae]MBD3926244.1 ANTAR domain-containing protein [Nocardioides cavernae]MBM7513837.1 GAF domain-containing protein [Nocardioides cavernae]